MRKLFISALAICALLLVSCQVKESLDVNKSVSIPETVGVPMTLKVDFATKTTYSSNGVAGFNCEWEAGDKISVISFDSDSDYASITAIDNFETTSGDGTFEGTFTGGSAARIMVVYPHLEAYEGNPSGNWGSEALNGTSGAGARRLIDGVQIGKGTMSLYPYSFVYSDENTDVDVIKERSILYGEATIVAGTMTATLQNYYGVLTVELDFRVNESDPWDLSPMSSALKTVEINADHFIYKYTSWAYLASFKAGSASNFSKIISYFGAPDSGEDDPTGLNLPTRPASTSSWVKYYIVGDFVDQQKDYVWTLTATDASGYVYDKELTFNSDYSFSKGSGAKLSTTVVATTPILPAATELDGNGTMPSNCYIVPCTAGTYSFATKSKRGFNYPSNYNAAFSAVVLWESLPYNNSVKDGDIIKNARLYNDNRVYVETTGNEGNAVVAVVNGSGEIVWSWHLWVTNYDPDTNGSDYNNINLDGDSYYMMKRNLGAFQNAGESVTGYREEQVGLYYQFGRKDPFVGVNDIYEASDNRETTNSGNWTQVDCGPQTPWGYTITHPMSFVRGVTNSKSWVPTVGQVDGYWGDVDDEQDPCPYGWRVADTKIWQAITDYADRTLDGSDVNFWGVAPDKRPVSKTINDSGTYGGTYQFDGLTLPYCGFYYCNTGDSSWSIWQTYSYSVDVGDAYYWGNSMFDDKLAYVFRASSIDMYQFENIYQAEAPAYGFQVRCVKD